MSRHFYRPYRNISSSSSNWSQWSIPILVSYCYMILILGMQEWFQRICHNKTIAQAKSLCNIYIYNSFWMEIYCFFFIIYATISVVISQKAV